MATDIASVIVSFAAVVVAIASIRFTNRGVAFQRAHNIISVRPLPFIALADYENHLRVKVRNDGIGPMLVHKVLSYRQGDLPVHEELVSYMPPLPAGLTWLNYSSGYVRTIPTAGELILLELQIDDQDIEHCNYRDACRSILSNIEIRVKYTDVYGSIMADEVRHLLFFGRRLASSQTG